MAAASGKAPLRVESGLVWALCAAPLLILLAQGFTGDLTANPVQYVLRELGVWGLRFLCITLAISPLARLGGVSRVMRYRRRVGLWAFAYVTMHLLMYVVVDQELDLGSIWTDIVKRPYITIGMAAFVLLVPLTVTSFNMIRRKMRPRTWQRLHRAIYLIAVMGVAHYYLLVKADHSDPIFYGVIVALLLAARFFPARRAGRKPVAVRTAP